MTREIAAIVLAAGRGARFDATQNKLLADFDGRPVIRCAVEAALASRARKTIVITGQDGAGVEAALKDLPVVLAHNPDFASGMASSLRVGLSHATDCAGALVLLGDMPQITPRITDQLIEAFETAPKNCVAAAPVHKGRRGNPVLLGEALFPRLAKLEGDEGARRLLRSIDGVLDVPIDDDGVLRDIDTRADLEALRWRS